MPQSPAEPLPAAVFENSSLTLPSGAHGGASRHQYNAACQGVKRRCLLLRDHLGTVAARAVIGPVLVAVGEGGKAGQGLEGARRAGREAVLSAVAGGDPGA